MSNHPRRGMVHDWPRHLAAFRTRHKLTQAQLADYLMLPESVVEAWEAGHYLPAPYLKLALERVEQKLKDAADACRSRLSAPAGHG